MVTTRSASKPTTQPVEGEQAPSSDSDGYDGELPPKKRRKRQKARVARRNTRRPMGELAGIMEMPIEIFVEIVSYLQPPDLLYISQATKRLRSVLMSITARFMWARARKNLPSFPHGNEFPDCPPHLTEPEYASLVFERSCLSCGKGKASNINLQSRMRSCTKCKVASRKVKTPTDFYTICELSGGLTDEIIAIYKLVPKSSDGRFFPPYARRIYHQCMKHKSKVGDGEYVDYLIELGNSMEVVKDHSRRLSAWNDAFLQERIRQNSLIQKERHGAIIERLVVGGWDTRDFPITSPCPLSAFWGDRKSLSKWNKLVLQVKPLTDKEWNTSKLKLEAIVRNNRTIRLEQEKRERAEESRLEDLRRRRSDETIRLYDEYVKSEMPEETFGLLPIGKEILAMPSIKILLERIDHNVPVPITNWEATLGCLGKDLQSYQENFRRELAALARARLRSISRLQPALAQGSLAETITIEEDHINLAFLTRDRSRMTFSSARYPGIQKPFPDILMEERAWKFQNQGCHPHELGQDFSITFMTCNIDQPHKFELVEGIWT